MEHVIHHLTLDLTKPDMMPRAEVQQDNARTLVISLTQGGRPYWIADGVTAVFSGRKPDGNPLFNACTVEKNRVRYEFTPQTTNVAGIVECEILLYSRDERILASPRFELAVDELIHRDSDVPESAPELSALTRMMAAGTAMIEDLERVLAGLEGVDEILEQAASCAEQAKEAAERAEKAAEEFGPGSVDMTGYAEKDWVREGFQPKGDYLTAAPVVSVNGRTGKVLLSAPDVGARPDSWTPTAKEVGALPAETKIPGKTSELTNDSGFIDKAVSDLRNYYTKAQTQELIAAIPRFRVAVVQQLPSPGEELVLYLVPFAGTEGQYIEYIWVEDRYEIIGIQQVDLTGYATEDWVRELLTDTAGDFLPMPKAYNAGAWLFAEEVDGKGNVSKTGTKVLDWVATHTSRVDPSDQVLVPEVTLQTGITNAFGYDTLVGQTEVLVVCDGKLHLCNVEFDYSEGDGYFYHLGNKSLLFQATDTGEPFFFHGYKGTSTMAHFSAAGEHTVEIYGGKEVLIYNKMPEEYLPDGVVRTVNGVVPDENGNVNVDGTGSGQNANGLNATARALLITVLRNGVYSTDQSANITALENALASGGSGDSGETEKTLTSISATYSGGSVPVGTAVSALTGVVVTARYSDGSTAVVTGYTLSGPIAEGSNTITVSYGGKTATFAVTGVAESDGGDAENLYSGELLKVNNISDVEQNGNVITFTPGANGCTATFTIEGLEANKDYTIFVDTDRAGTNSGKYCVCYVTTEEYATYTGRIAELRPARYGGANDYATFTGNGKNLYLWFDEMGDAVSGLTTTYTVHIYEGTLTERP